MTVGMLLSYHYFKDRTLEDVCGDWRPLLFADSGAFSADSQGVTIELDDYAAWLDANRDYIDVACTLDVIGDADATAENTRRLEDHGHRVLPVFHVGEPFEWLHHWCENYDYIGIGGMVPYSRTPAKLLRWIVKCMRIAEPYGTQFHGLGLTTISSLTSLPLFSVDSSSWASFKRFGTLSLWCDMHGWHTVGLSDRLSDPHVMAIMRRYDIDPAQFARPDYATLGERTDIEVFRAEREVLQQASLRSWCRFHRWWHDRFAPVTVPGMTAGPHVFIVSGNNGDVDVGAVRTALQTEESSHADAAAEVH